jgi:propionyl-CoA carboxylase alpha chain
VNDDAPTVPTENTVIHKLLVANRGEIARRVMRTCRSLGIATVAVHADPDAGAAFVREADEAVSLGGSTPAESYLRGAAIVAAALAAGADAVHPGYGFLSENAPFARAVLAAGLVWVGPPPAAIEAMGSKLAARARMAAAGVPVLPGEDLTGVGDDALATVADRVGWPIMVKASAGGGGRGMRVVRAVEDLTEAVAGARREAAGAFGDDTVFLEHYVDEPRHVEIQIFGDTHGTLVHLHERECSIQRRHQKIIEEAPSPALTPQRRAEMGAAAVAAGEAIGYVGAGTVEFVLAPSGEFFFLEVNTRLQVEHPVTEAITGLDLVALQLAVAEGRPLPDAARHPVIRGHAIEARLYAEDPLADFLPATGTLQRFELGRRDVGRFEPGRFEMAGAAGVRVDSGFETGDTVSVHYDPMLAKVIAHGATRAEAVRALAAALRRARIHGVTTNRDLLVGVLEHPEFAAGRTDTHFLERHPPATLAGGPDRAEVVLSAVAAALMQQHQQRHHARVWAEAPSGWRNNPGGPATRRYTRGADSVEIGYRMGGPGTTTVEVDGAPFDVTVGAVTAETVELTAGGVRRRYHVDIDTTSAWVDTTRGGVRLTCVPRFPPAEAMRAAGSLVAPMPGVVVRVDVAAGDTVKKGQRLLVLEAMKMEHQVTAPAAGIVTALNVKPGLGVDAGAVLAVVDEQAEQEGKR